VIDAIPEQQSGRRNPGVNALGAITIETTAEGIRRLAESPEGNAALEDQAVFQLD